MQQVLAATAPGAQLEHFLSDECQQLDKPFVRLLDEVDGPAPEVRCTTPPLRHHPSVC